MNKPIDELIETMKENELMKDLITMPGADFNRALEIIRQKRFERAGIVYCPDNPTDQDTPEG